ncbi:hypothetical protein NLX65_00685 [Candidatus Cardinium sp. TP]|nr:hypothetical protein [Candidatus Cardinium sp. TP]
MLSVTSIYFSSCFTGTKCSELVLRDELMRPLLEASAYITGTYQAMDEHGHIMSETTDHPKDLEKAHQSLVALMPQLIPYQKTIQHPIASTLLDDMHNQLCKLEKDIEERLPDGLDKNQFRKELKQLAQYLTSLMDKKDVSLNSTTYHSPTD